MEPISIVSSVVGVISLAEYALRLGTALCQMIAKARAASDQLDSLHTELQQLTGVIDNLKELMELMKECQESIPVNGLDGILVNMEEVLHSFISEVEDFKKATTTNESNQRKCFMKCIVQRLQFVGNEAKINGILSRIATRKFSLISLNLTMLLT